MAYKPMLALGLGMSAVLGVAMAGVLYFLRPPPPPTEARFIVVESPDPGAPRGASPSPRDDMAATEPAAAARASASEPVVPAPVVARAGAPRSGHPGRAPRGGTSAALTRAVARHEGALGACFDRHAATLVGTPEIAISFEVDASGTVQSAALVPASLEGTALGRCLLDVARGISFGRLDKTTRFTIPIQARATR